MRAGASAACGSGTARSLAVFLNGELIGSVDARGGPVVDASFFVLFNAHHEPLPFTVPELPHFRWGRKFTIVVDTRHDQVGDGPVVQAGETLVLEGRSLVLLRRVD